MIISHKYKYIFVSIPHTASTVIEEELCEYYNGQKVRYKHSLPVLIPRKYSSYKVVGGIRNPSQDLVSQYNKYLTDHLGIYSSQVSGDAANIFMTQKSKKQFLLIQAGEMSLDQYINSQLKSPYVPRIELNYCRYDYVYQCEKLSVDFDQMLRILNVEKVRDLPLGNRTEVSKKSSKPTKDLTGFSVSLFRFGYSEKKPKWFSWFNYHIYRELKCWVWYFREILSIIKNRGFYSMVAYKANKVEIDFVDSKKTIS